MLRICRAIITPLPGRISLAPGGVLRLNGKPYRLEQAPGRPRMTDEALIAPDDAVRVERSGDQRWVRPGMQWTEQGPVSMAP